MGRSTAFVGASLISAVTSIVSTACAGPRLPEHARDEINEAVLRWVINYSVIDTDADTTAEPAAYCVASENGDFTGIDVQDPAPSIMVRFGSAPVPVRPISACDISWHVLDTITGGRAVAIDIGPVERVGRRTAEMRAAYLWRGGGRGWLCTIERANRSWSVAACETEVHF